MKIIFWGGAEEVGRSCVEIRENGKNLLLDCGIKIGKREEYPLIKKIPNNIVITHSHLDHAAYLPHIFTKPRPRTTLYMTKPTRDLIQLMIADYMRVSKKEFNSNVLNNILTRCKTVEYNETVDCGLKFSLHNSGHMLGSASVLVRSKKGNLLYTSDISLRASKVVDPAEMGLHAKAVIVESTYGGKNDVIPSVKEEASRLRDIIKDTLKRNGKVLIPAFAVGRAQEIILMLDAYMRNGLIDPAPIYIDGMIKKALRLFRHNVIYARKELQRSILVSDLDPFKSRYVFVPERMDRIDAIEEGSIIITTSGMMKGGPVMTYFKEMAGDERNTLLFVGYQAPGTPGRMILDGAKRIKVYGKYVDVRMRVESLQISGHADQRDLIRYINSIKGLEKIFIVHGEDAKRKELKDALKDYEVILPKNGESYNL